MGEQVFICLNGLPFEVINNNNNNNNMQLDKVHKKKEYRFPSCKKVVNSKKIVRYNHFLKF